MISTDFSHKNGVVTFDNLFLDENKPLIDQLDDLKEDMLQVEFPNAYLLDVGWTPSFNINGKFKIVLIKDYDWQKPVYTGVATNVKDLEREMSLAVSEIPTG